MRLRWVPALLGLLAAVHVLPLGTQRVTNILGCP
jgi:hypothetical protein